MAFLLCLLGAKRLLTVDDTGKKKEKKGRGSHRETAYRGVAVRGCVAGIRF